MDKKRFTVQALAALIQNANLKGFLSGKIYTGNLKQACVPGINCYSCPGALGACPLGSLQNVLGSRPFKLPYYVMGILLFFGALLGRAVCGFLCPMGWLQELVHLIPFPIKKNRFRGDRSLRWVKYLILALTLVLPLFLPRIPFFCKYLCPSGTLAGISLAAVDSSIRPLLGKIFGWKLTVLVLIILGCLMVWRPFCKYLCPLGAIYGFFNRISLYRLRVDDDKCIHCKKCAAVCRMCVDPAETPNSAECIRCGDCAHSCPTNAIHLGWKIVH